MSNTLDTRPEVREDTCMTTTRKARPRPPFTDEFIAGWTDDDVRAHFNLPRDPAKPNGNGGLPPFCITRETRNGVKGFRTTDMRGGGSSLRTRTKAAATRIAKVIEQDVHDAYLARKAREAEMTTAEIDAEVDAYIVRGIGTAYTLSGPALARITAMREVEAAERAARRA